MLQAYNLVSESARSFECCEVGFGGAQGGGFPDPFFFVRMIGCNARDFRVSDAFLQASPRFVFTEHPSIH